MLETVRKILAEERDALKKKIEATKGFKNDVGEGEIRPFLRLLDNREQILCSFVKNSFLEREELNEDRIILDWVRDLELWESVWDIQYYVFSFIREVEIIIKLQIEQLFTVPVSKD